MSYEPTWKERLEDAKAYLGPAIAGVVIVGLAGWLVWHELVPRQKAKRIDAVATKDEVVREELRRKLTAEVDLLRQDYQRSLEAGEGDAAIHLHLDRLIARQRERVKLDPGGVTPETARLAEFEEERTVVRIRVLTARSLRLEQEARLAPGTLEALEKLRDALRLQREANSQSQSGKVQDLARERRLAEAVAEAEADPTRAELGTVLTLARAAAARGEREAALKGYAAARGLQAKLTALHPQRPYGNPARLEELDAEAALVREASLAELAAGREREGDAAARSGSTAEAAQSYLSAASLQRERAEKFPRVREEALRRAEQVEVKRQTLLSAAPLARVATLEREINSLLRDQLMAPAGEKISAAAALLEKTAAEFPRSSLLALAAREKLEFLGSKVRELEVIQRQVLSQPMPLGRAERLREVSQELFSRVMDSNPSRNREGKLPVDSVTWSEAQEFCRRLGWLLGGVVRLPIEQEAQAFFSAPPVLPASAAASGRPSESANATAGRVNGANPAGLLAIWLSAPTNEPKAGVFGASSIDNSPGANGLAARLIPKTERSSAIGLRYVMETPP